MVDFVKSFQQGLTSADIARKNREEIGSVFDELNAQLNSATGGKIQISLFSDPMVAILNAFAIKPIYNSIGAINPLLNNRPVKLANWVQHSEGYPCTITVGKTVTTQAPRFPLC